MIFLVPRGWVIFFGPERLGNFFVPRGWGIFCCPERSGDFFVPRGWVIFFGGGLTRVKDSMVFFEGFPKLELFWGVTTIIILTSIHEALQVCDK